MKNKKCKNVLFSILVTIVCTFSIGVDASIREVVDTTNTSYDHIARGTTIIGVTKFNSSVSMSGRRIKVATDNARDYSDSIDTEIYYYSRGGTWQVFDDDNNLNPVTDQSIIDSLNDQNIFYVNNVEKSIKVNYGSSTDNLTVVTDNSKTVKKSGTTLTVPATVKSFDVLENGSVVATYLKLKESDVKYVANPVTGSLSYEGDLVGITVNKSLLLQGNVAYKINADDDNGNTVGENGKIMSDNGNIVTVGVTRKGRVETEADRKKIVFTVRDAGEKTRTFNWGVDNVDITKNIDILFTDEVREAYIDVKWETGNTQTFKVTLTSGSELEAEPVGTIDWDLMIGEDFGFDWYVEGDTLYVTGDIVYYSEDNIDDVPEGNRVGIYLYNDKYATPEARARVRFDDLNTDPGYIKPVWDEDEGAFHYIPKVTEEYREITIEVTWEPGFTQTFTLDATEATLLEEE